MLEQIIGAPCHLIDVVVAGERVDYELANHLPGARLDEVGDQDQAGARQRRDGERQEVSAQWQPRSPPPSGGRRVRRRG